MFYRLDPLMSFLCIGSMAVCLVGIQILVDDNDNSYELLSSYCNYIGHCANYFM